MLSMVASINAEESSSLCFALYPLTGLAVSLLIMCFFASLVVCDVPLGGCCFPDQGLEVDGG